MRQPSPTRCASTRQHWLSPLAVRSYETRGRNLPEEECRLRTPFQRDRDRIVHSKAFRRLRHKTQVFVDPEGDHFRTRLTHTLETTGIARGVARALRLNEDLIEAIGLGHDLGHPPFGHAGEQALDELLRERGGRGFRHNEHSLRVVERLERDGRGLNLTWEVRDGILKHTGRRRSRRRSKAASSGSSTASPTSTTTSTTPCARSCSRPASCRRRRSRCSARPARAASTRSSTTSSRRPPGSGDIVQSDEIGEAMLALRAFMFEHVYLQQDHAPARAAVRRIFEQLVDARGMDAEEATDYLAGMTDRFALAYAAELD